MIIFFKIQCSFAQCTEIYVESGSTTVCPGEPISVWLYSYYYGSGGPYQWFRNGQYLPGDTFSVTQQSTPGDYYLVDYGWWCSYSNVITIAVDSVPVVAVSATGSSAICSRSTVQLTASVGNSFSNQFKWQLNGTDIPGETSSTYNAGVGNYTCIVSNMCGADTSSIFTVQALSTPAGNIYSSGPSVLCNGGTVILATDSSPNYTYTWYKSGVALSGITLPDYVVNAPGNYYVKVKDTTDNCSRSSPVIVASFGPTIVSVTSSPTSSVVCSGTSVTLTASANVSIISYQWKKDGVPISLATASQYTFTATDSSTYTVDATNICGITTSPGYTPTIIPLPPSVITTASSAAFCSGDSVILNANTGLNFTYQWYLDSANTAIAGATSSSYTSYASESYHVRITDTITGCKAISSSVRTGSNGLVASVSPSGPVRACTSAFLSANGGAGYTYQWRKNGVDIIGAISQTYTDTTFGAFNYDVVITGTCGSNVSNVVSVTLDSMLIPHSSVLIFINLNTCSGLCGSGSLTMCQGQNAEIGFNRWFPYGPSVVPQWYLNGDSIHNGDSFLSPQDYYNWVINNLTAPGVYYCDIANGCGVTRSDTNTLSVNPSPSVNIYANGATTFCTGGSVALSVDTATGQTYQWQRNGLNIIGADSANYTATLGGTYKCFISNSSSCSVTSDFINVTVSLLSPLIASATTQICQGGTVPLNTVFETGSSYQWRYNGADIIGAASSTYIADTIGSYSCMVTNGCGTALSNVIDLSTLNDSVVASGSVLFCQGSSVILSNQNLAPGLVYQWQKNGVNISAGNLSYYAASDSGIYSCVVSTVTCSDTANRIAVSIIYAPVASVSANSATTICPGDSVTLTANIGTGLTYQWKNGTTAIIGATSISYTAHVAGSYTCVVTNSCDNTTSNAITVTLNSSPSASITANGATIFCSGDSVTLTANSGTGLTYQWKNGATAIIGATSISYTAHVAGSYTCVVINSCGNTTSNAITVTLNSSPSGSITASGATTFCSGDSVRLNADIINGVSYQWLLNDGILGGQTAPSYLATSAGNYSCVFSNTCGADTSNIILVSTIIHPSTPANIFGAFFPRSGAQGVHYYVASVSGATYYQWTVPSSAMIVSGQGTSSITVNFSPAFVWGFITVTAGNSCGTSMERFKFVGNIFNVHLPPRNHSGVLTHRLENIITDREPEFTAAVYPNPGKDYFTIQVSSENESEWFFVIRDITGREIERKEKIPVDENVQFGYNLLSGIYFAEVIQGNSRKVLKLIKSE